jgi:8-oxo-dGTP pyrophosphatase MutT (NUDIX family)
MDFDDACCGSDRGRGLRDCGAVSVKKEPGEPRTQVAALPIRREKRGEVRVLLITSRETKRWIIPKGWPMKGRTNAQAAAQEALEEAGLEGRVQKEPFGKYLYWKRGEANFELCEVLVYLLDVKRQRETWREKGQREARWFSVEDAAELVEEPGLTAVIASLGDDRR